MIRYGWRWFPLWMILSMLAVFVVNGYMVFQALASFPGAAGTDGFDLSNGYKRVLAAAEQQSELGWRVQASVDANHHPMLILIDRSGAPLANPLIEAHAERPVGPAETTTLPFQAAGKGRYRSDTTLFSGQWDIMATVRAGGQEYSTTWRVVVH